MSSATDAFVTENRDRFLSELKDFIRIPSISTLPEHAADIDRAANFVAESLRHAGMENVEIILTAGHPLVYADWMHAPGKPTVLCYGHYDVQPADPLELWVTPAFEPTERNGNLYARGAVDDKGQMYMHIKAIETLRAVNGTLPVNIKFLVEGEEEVGGEAIAKYVAENPDKLKADVALVSDTAMYAEGMPTLCIGLRGLIYMEVEATGPAARSALRPLRRRGAQRCLWADPATGEGQGRGRRASRFPASTTMWTNPRRPNRRVGAACRSTKGEFLGKEVGATSLTGEPKRTVLERVWSRPTFEVHGIAGGFTAAGPRP